MLILVLLLIVEVSPTPPPPGTRICQTDEDGAVGSGILDPWPGQWRWTRNAGFEPVYCTGQSIKGKKIKLVSMDGEHF